MRTNTRRLTEIQSWDEVPNFASEAEEAEFWSTHALGDALLDRMEPIPESELPLDIRRTRPVSVRLGEDVVERLEALARRRNVTPQALVKGFIVDGLNEGEAREGPATAAGQSARD